MTRLLKIIVVLIAAIGVAYYFLIDGIIKTQIEQRGSLALHAPLNVDGVTFHLFRGTLALRGIALADAQSPQRKVVQADSVALAFSLRDLLKHEVLVNTVHVDGLRADLSHLPKQQTSTPAATPAAAPAKTPEWRDALQRVKQMLGHRVEGGGGNTSLTGAMLTAAFKPTLDRTAASLDTFMNAPDLNSPWHILVRRIDVNGALTFAGDTVRITGTINDVTPQPHWFNVATTFAFRNAPGEPVTLRADGRLDKRKQPRASLSFDIAGLPVRQWPLSNTPQLRIVIADAKANAQGSLNLTGERFTLDTRAHFERAHLNVSTAGGTIADAAANVWRGADNFDIHAQASGDVRNPTVNLSSSLDKRLDEALQRLKPAAGILQALPFLKSR